MGKWEVRPDDTLQVEEDNDEVKISAMMMWKDQLITNLSVS